MGIPYVNAAGFKQEKECLPGTGEELLDVIMDWINNVEDVFSCFLVVLAPENLWLLILLVTGFTSWASSFCFSTTQKAAQHLNNILSIVGHHLADHDPLIKQALWKMIHDSTSLQTTTDIVAQFENFILKPAKQLTISGSIVIVIDALDESGGVQSCCVLLSLLAKRMSELPSNFWIVLTT